MRKIFITFLLFLMPFAFLNAQTTLTTAVDFDVVDVHGTQIHLFDILAGGQYVFIEFWASW